MCSKNLSPEYKIKLWRILSRIDRAPFKLECCQHILDRIQKLERPKTLTADYRFKVELAVDCFLAEIIGVMDSLLQEINDRLGLGLPREKVDITKIDKALKDVKKLNKKQRADLLQDIWDMKCKNWLWLLNQYRNMAVHRSPLKFIPILTLDVAKGLEFQEIRVQPVEGDSDPREREIFQYLSDSLRQMRKMVKAIEEKLDLMKT